MTTTHLHPLLRRTAAAAAALVAGIYLLIGTGTVTVVADQPAGTVPPILIAAVLFGVLAGLLLLVPRRWVWFAGAALQVLVIVGYLAISVDRTPAFEVWGITQKVVQTALLVALAYLAVGRPARGSKIQRTRPRAATTA